MKLTTTLNKIRASSPCTSGWKKLLSHLGTDFNPDAEINLLTVLESNCVTDMLWARSATEQDSKRIASQLAIEFAEQSLPIFENRHPEDQRPRRAIQAARDYLDGKIDLEALREARVHAAAAAAAADDAADDADDAGGGDAAAYAAYAATYAAAAATYAADYAATDAAADYAADAATYAAADYAREKAREKQADIIRMILEA